MSMKQRTMAVFHITDQEHGYSWPNIMKLEQSVTPELRVALELEAHEKECAIRYASVEDKLSGLDKRLWRLEAMIMASTIVIVGLAGSLLMKL